MSGPSETDSGTDNKSGELIDLAKKRKKKEKADSSERGSVKKIDLYRAYLSVMKGENTSWPRFPHKIITKRSVMGQVTILLEREDETVHYIADDYAIDLILAYVGEFKGIVPPILKKDAKEIFSLYSAESPTTGPISPVLPIDVRGRCFHRLPFAFSTIEEMPLFEDLMSRIGNNEALCSWIGSLFDASSEVSQYCWIYGSGGEGKSTLARFLAKAFGPTYKSEQPSGENDQFWTSGLVGKRLVVFPDCNNYGFMQRGTMKAITGNDEVRVEFKFKGSESVKLDSKFMVLSNEMPKISGHRADTRRIIYCAISPPTKDFGPNYEDRLWHEEGKSFLTHCYFSWLSEKARNGGKYIAVDQESMEKIVTATEEIYADIVERNWKIIPFNKEEIENTSISGEEFLRICREEKLPDQKINGVKKYLVLKGVDLRKIQTPSGRKWRYCGLIRRSSMEKSF